MATYSILPADSRMNYLTQHPVFSSANLCHSWNDIPKEGYLVCATPFTKDGITVNTTLSTCKITKFLSFLTSQHIIIGGGFPAEVTGYFQEKNIRYYDVLTSPNFAQKNAKLTAEGLLISLFSHTDISVRDFVPLIIGYGKCGKEIADVLRYFTSEIYIYDICQDALYDAKKHNLNILSMESSSQINIIINTSPKNPFSSSQWSYFYNCDALFQVASGTLKLPSTFPGKQISCPGIPGKYAPKTAAICMAQEICNHFHL